MATLKIGYVPQSHDLKHPADRRRLIYWAQKRGHEIVLDLDQKTDVIVLSGRADFASWSRKESTRPIVLDLIDGYLGDERLWKDWARGIGKVLVHQATSVPRRYSDMVAEACTLADAVICATIEQKTTILPYCTNTHTILDFHEEFPMLTRQDKQIRRGSTTLMWEGQPFTVKGLRILEDIFPAIASTGSVKLHLVTDLQYPLILGKYLYGQTEKILGNIPRTFGGNFQISEWSIEKVIQTAKESQLAILPLHPSNPLNSLKPENRLLIMWRLGLPCLVSPSLAYNRVMKSSGVDGICVTPEDWKAKLGELIGSEDLRDEGVERGQQYIRDNHSEEKVLSLWDELFESVL